VRLLACGQIEFGNDTPEENERTNDALVCLGLVAEESQVIQCDEYWLWPENEDAFSMWLAIQTQWDASMAGATGLKYPGVETVLRMRGLKKKARQKMFLLIQMMERACLDEWARKRKT